MAFYASVIYYTLIIIIINCRKETTTDKSKVIVNTNGDSKAEIYMNIIQLHKDKYLKNLIDALSKDRSCIAEN